MIISPPTSGPYKIEDVGLLRAVHEGIETVDTPGELRSIYRSAGDNGGQGRG